MAGVRIFQLQIHLLYDGISMEILFGLPQRMAEQVCTITMAYFHMAALQSPKSISATEMVMKSNQKYFWI
jgi:hypothetical protein